MTSATSDLRSSAAVLKRRRWVLIVAAVLGIAAGVGYVIYVPPTLTSTTLVLLPTPAVASASSSDVSTQVRIATSANVLNQAGRVAVPGMSTRDIEKMVEVTAPTDQIIQIDASSTDAATAQALSQAVADAYVAYVSDTAREVTRAALADLNARRDRLREQIDKLQAEIAATLKRQRQADPDSPDGRKEAQLLAGLRAQQANLSLQLDKVEDKIATGLGSAAGAATSIVQPATTAVGASSPMRLLFWVPLFGLVVTAGTACVLVALARRDPGVRFRDQIADAVGSPVLAAVRSRPQRSAAGWRTLLGSYEATPVESWAYRQLLRAVAPAGRPGELRAVNRLDHPRTLAVVTLSGDTRGVAIGPQLAAFTSSLGISTRLVTVGSDHGAASLWAACASARGNGGSGGPYLGEPPAGETADLTINVCVADRKNPDITEASTSAAVLLSVAAGAATEQDLARLAVAADDAGHRIDGIIVANPDPTDRTSGRHTMDERSRQVTLPVRLTGIASPAGRNPADRRRSRP